MNHNISPVYTIKCLFGGEAGVGKTSLVQLIKNGIYDPNTEPTIAIEFCVQTVELKEYPYFQKDLPAYYFQEVKTGYNLQTIKTNIWDAAGSSRFKSIVQSYMRDLDVVFLVFSLSDRDSWDALPGWKEEIDKNNKYGSIPLIVIIGTKSDLRHHQVNEVEIHERCKEWNAKRFIISSVQRNSAAMIQRMLYKTVQNYHEHILERAKNNEKVPDHVKIDNFNHFISRLNLDVQPASHLCCNVQ